MVLGKKIRPNLECVESVKDLPDLKSKLAAAVQKADPKSIYLDLEPLIADANFVKNLSKNIKSILTAQINSL